MRALSWPISQSRSTPRTWMILSSPELVLDLMITGLWSSSLLTQRRVAFLRPLRTITQEGSHSELVASFLLVCWFYSFSFFNFWVLLYMLSDLIVFVFYIFLFSSGFCTSDQLIYTAMFLLLLTFDCEKKKKNFDRVLWLLSTSFSFWNPIFLKIILNDIFGRLSKVKTIIQSVWIMTHEYQPI